MPERPLYPRKRTLVAKIFSSGGKLTLDVRFTPKSGHAEVLTFGGNAVAAVPGRSGQISPQGDPIAAGVEGPLRRPRAKIQIPGLLVLKRAGSSAEDGRANPAI